MLPALRSLTPWPLPNIVACDAQAAVPGGISAVNPRRTKVGFTRDGAVSDFAKAMGLHNDSFLKRLKSFMITTIASILIARNTMAEHVFISYSNVDGLAFATKLATELESGQPFIRVWFDKNEMSASSDDWDDQIASAIGKCKCLLFVMSPDSTAKLSNCKEEWTWALKCKKPVICLLLDPQAEDQFRLNNRQKIDFSSNFDAGLAKLKKAIDRLDTREGLLDELNHRLADANRDLHRAKPEDMPRIQADIDELKKQIEVQQKIVDNPEAAQAQTQKNIESGLERERQPEKPVAGRTSTKFINSPPGIAPDYFQDRYFETEQIAHFLKNDAQRLMTIVGRAGIGKTATICRLLKDLERGVLPDNLGEMKVDGIVYLSEAGSHKINFANIFYDLCKLLSTEAAQELDSIYKNPQGSTESKMHALLDRFHGEHVILLLDNLEPLINDELEDLPLRDAELDEALHAYLNGTHTAVKAIITTRIPPHQLNNIQPGRQRIYHLEAGLEPKYAEEMLRQMDADGIVGLRNADGKLLKGAYERTRGFPKALEALFQILASDRYSILEELLDMPTPENVVEALVGEAFNRLDSSAQKVMQALAVYNRPVAPTAVDYVLAPHLPAMDSAPILQRLANMHFARKESGRFYLHPVDREFAFGLVPADDSTAKDAKGAKKSKKESSRSLRALRFKKFAQHDLTLRAADYFAQARKPRAEWKKLDDLAAQLAEFDLRCAAGDYDTACSVLREIDFDYLLLWGHYRLMIQLHEQVTGNIDDPSLRMGNLNGLGLAYRELGDARKSILYFEQGVSAAQDSKNRSWQGVCLGNLGGAYSELGEARKAIEFYEQALVVAREVGDKRNEGNWLGGLGNAYADLGETRKAIEFCERALVIAREIGNKRDEGNWLGNLGTAYADLGEAREAIEFYEEALIIRREIGDRSGEETDLANLTEALSMEGQYSRAIENGKQSLAIALELGIPASYEYGNLSQAYLFDEQLDEALKNAKQAQKFDEPKNNHNVSTLLGIIALRQGDRSAARQAFTRAISQADEIFAKTLNYYDALDTKGLALCGLALTVGADLRLRPAGGQTRGSAPTEIDDAIETFRKARKIAPHAGLARSVLRLFDELAKCDESGLLEPVRAAVEGKE